MGEEARAAVAAMKQGAIEGKDPRVEAIRSSIENGKFFPIMDGASCISQRFERMSLRGFYDRITAAIREVDPHHIIVFETALGAGAGTRLLSAVDLPRNARGEPFPNVVLSPHNASASARFDPARKRRVGQEIANVLSGRWPLSCVNPTVLPASGLKRWQPISMDRGPNS